jgi:hypothetical protein
LGPFSFYSSDDFNKEQKLEYLKRYFDKKNKKFFSHKTFHGVENYSLYCVFMECLKWVLENISNENSDEFKVKIKFMESFKF